MFRIFRYLIIGLVFLCLSISSYAAVNQIEEADGSPSKFPWKIKFDNGSLTDNGDGTITHSIAGSGLAWLISTDQTLLTGDKSGSFDLTTSGVISTPDINRTATQNLELFDDSASIGNSDDGRHFIINRHAPEGDSYLESYIDKDQVAIINSGLRELQLQGDLLRINTTSGTFSYWPATFGNTLTLASGSITDAGGAISFGNENLTTTGTATSGVVSTLSINIVLYENEMVCVNNDIVFS